jgi:hypothetical protein
MNSDQEFEKRYWGNCANTFDEEQKHYTYAKYMGILQVHYSFLVPHPQLSEHQFSVLDIGGGPVSMLLKVMNLKQGLVVDPLPYPDWTRDRYAAHNIGVHLIPAENLDVKGWDEVWIYNCLQHVQDPAVIIRRACTAAKVLRIFEWVDVEPHEGHPHKLTKESLDDWILGGLTTKKAVMGFNEGNVVSLRNERGCTGKAYYNVVQLVCS